MPSISSSRGSTGCTATSASSSPSRSAAAVRHDDARDVALPEALDAVITSPPSPGLIEYHEQHRYACELLGLADERPAEIGGAARGTSFPALAAYTDGVAAVLGRCAARLRPGAPVVVVVNDRRSLYPPILEHAGLVLEERLQRHVNRRTGRRAGEHPEDVLVRRAWPACRGRPSSEITGRPV